VDEARKKSPDEQRARAMVEAAGRFLTAMAGDLPGYEEASRALYRRDWARLRESMATWPADVRAYAERMTAEIPRAE
jgi:hypothetical protein